MSTHLLNHREVKRMPQKEMTFFRRNKADTANYQVEVSSYDRHKTEENGNKLIKKGVVDSGGDNCEVRSSQPEQIKETRFLLTPLTFWYLKNENTREWNWKHNQVPVVSVMNSEACWFIHNYIELPSRLDDGCDYSIFKQGISPDWEHKDNIKGGRWIRSVKKDENLDDFWRKLTDLMLEEEMLVNGVVVSKREKGDKMAVWLRDAREDDDVNRVGTLLKEKLKVDDKWGFRIHNGKYKGRWKGE